MREKLEAPGRGRAASQTSRDAVLLRTESDNGQPVSRSPGLPASVLQIRHRQSRPINASNVYSTWSRLTRKTRLSWQVMGRTRVGMWDATGPKILTICGFLASESPFFTVLLLVSQNVNMTAGSLLSRWSPPRLSSERNPPDEKENSLCAVRAWE